MPRSHYVLALAASALLVLQPLGPAAADETLTVPNPASTSDTGAWASSSVAIPEGQSPRSVQGLIETTASSGEIQLRVGQRILKTFPAQQAGEFAIDLDEPARTLLADAENGGRLSVGARWVPEDSAGRCLAAQPEQVSLSGLRIKVEGEAAAPQSIAEFLAMSPKRVAIQATDQSAAAAMTAVPAIATAFSDADVSWEAKNPDLTVRFDASGGKLKLKLDRAGTTLTVSGDAQEFAGLDSVLRTEAISLATGTETTAKATPDEPVRWAPPEELSLKDLGLENPRLEGYGQSSLYAGVDEAVLGASMQSVLIHLAGTHSALPSSAEAALNVYWNDSLVGSYVLDAQDTSINTDIAVPESLVKGRNGLRIQLDAAAVGAECRTAGSLPVQVHLDGAASSITPAYGTSATQGFEMLPQAASGQIGLALGQSAEPSDAYLLATGLLASLQQASGVPLQVTLLPEEEVASSPLSAIVVGASAATINELGAPLRLEEMRTIDAGMLSAGVGTEAPYAALQAFTSNSRTILAAGSWAPGDATGAAESSRADGGSLYADLAHQVLASEGGWSALSRNLLIAQPDAEPVLLESNSVVPQPSRTDDYRVYGWWAVGGLAVLVALGAAGALVYRRTNRKARAQAEAEAKAAAPSAARDEL